LSITSTIIRATYPPGTAGDISSRYSQLSKGVAAPAPAGRVDADLPFDIEADGELLGTTPATFEVIPGAIR